MKKVFIIGCGYVGTRVARIWKGLGADVTCLVRSAEHQAVLESEGFVSMSCSFDDLTSIPSLDVAGSILYYFVPPPGGGTADSRARHFCNALSGSSPPAMIVYMSATSVYSEKHGGIVTETSDTVPAAAMGKRRLDAEAVFREYGAVNNVPVIILRVSGIYGPGRLPLMQFSQGQPLLREDEAGPSNRIHADDLALVCLAAAEKAQDGDIFNVSDGHPSSMTVYFNACADALHLPRQPQVTMEEARQVMSPLMFSYVGEARIVDNSRMLSRLGITLRYSDLTVGIDASLG
ncbi:MAG: NAD(P)-dependent oxidoreductase [Desulfuromonadaceae bacterium GWB2_53_15]|nr:MAG: NAD(P)-dependent oxidoreductase [Desulfuromonadaceae bacterium GWB2_53_15]